VASIVPSSPDRPHAAEDGSHLISWADFFDQDVTGPCQRMQIRQLNVAKVLENLPELSRQSTLSKGMKNGLIFCTTLKTGAMNLHMSII
jgi:hypothetical protein